MKNSPPPPPLVLLSSQPRHRLDVQTLRSETPETDVKDSCGTPIAGKKDVNTIKIDAEIRKCIERPFTTDGVKKMKKGPRVRSTSTKIIRTCQAASTKSG